MTRTDWQVYPTSKVAQQAAQREANDTGVPQYVEAHRVSGWIVTPEADSPFAVPFMPSTHNGRLAFQ